MKLLVPQTIDDAALISSTIAETDEAEYAAGTTYALGDRVMVAAAHRIYESLQAANTGNAPSLSPTWWLDAGPTNRWAMWKGLDGATSSDTDVITVEVDVGAIDDVVFVALAAERVLISGTDVYINKLVPTPVAPATTVTMSVTDIGFAGGTLHIEIHGTGTVSVRNVSIGNYSEIGDAQHGLQLGMTDYSKKTTDDFGNVSVARRGFSRRISGRVVIDTDQVDHVAELLASVRATACVWQVAQRHEALSIFGYYTDWSIDITYPVLSYYSITLESLASDNLDIVPGSLIPSLAGALLLEGGGYLLAEDGTRILIEA